MHCQGTDTKSYYFFTEMGKGHELGLYLLGVPIFFTKKYQCIASMAEHCKHNTSGTSDTFMLCLAREIYFLYSNYSNL